VDTNERATLYVQFLEAAAKEYCCKTTDMPAKMAASRRLSFEIYTAQLIEGRNPDPATLRLFLEEEQRHAPPASPLKVTVKFVDEKWSLPELPPPDHPPKPPAKPVEAATPAPPPKPRPPPELPRYSACTILSAGPRDLTETDRAAQAAYRLKY